jgi:heptosyltransferase-2
MAREPFPSLWSATGDVDDSIVLEPGTWGTIKAVFAVTKGQFDAAFVFPNSFRSALVPFLAGVPLRRGVRGHSRAFMLTEVPKPSSAGEGSVHQSREYLGILGMDAGLPFPSPPYLVPPRPDVSWAESATGMGRPGWLVAMMPGAARGPSKQWPADRFAQVGRRLVSEAGCRIAILGADPDSRVCEAVRQGIGPGAFSLCGRTTVLKLAAVLARCSCAVSNDSGGMHLAAAVGTPVVAVFGITDHTKTGPLGAGHRIVTDPGLARSRDVPSRSAMAEAALRAIDAGRVFDAVAAVVNRGGVR